MLQCRSRILLDRKCAISVALVTDHFRRTRHDRRVFVFENHLAPMCCTRQDKRERSCTEECGCQWVGYEWDELEYYFHIQLRIVRAPASHAFTGSDVGMLARKCE